MRLQGNEDAALYGSSSSRIGSTAQHRRYSSTALAVSSAASVVKQVSMR